MVRAIGLVFALVGAGCVASAPSARVTVEPPSPSQFVGEWSGTYLIDGDSKGGGTLAFTLQAKEGDLASGTVVIKAEGATEPFAPSDFDEPASDAPARPATPLAIRMLPASDGLVYGDVEKYWDAARRTDATLTLRGELDGDSIRGTFRTTYANGSAQTLGRWSVARLKSSS